MLIGNVDCKEQMNFFKDDYDDYDAPSLSEVSGCYTEWKSHVMTKMCCFSSLDVRPARALVCPISWRKEL